MTTQDQIKALAELDGWILTKKDDPVYRNKFIYSASRNGKSLTYQQTHVLDNRDEYMGSREEFFSTEWNFDSESDICRSLPNYLTSYDAIIPLIQKLSMMDKETMCKIIGVKNDYCAWIRATPSQLAEALLRATGKWKD